MNLVKWLGWVLVVGVLVACARPTVTPAQEIRIGVIGMLSEPGFSADGKWMQNALELGAKQLNASGGVEVNGQRYRVTLVVEDDKNSPQEAAAAATRLINQQNVVAIIGPLYSGTALAAGQVAENARVPLISPTATSPAVTAGRQYVFRVCFTDEVQGKALARFLRVNAGYNYAAVVYDVSDAYNQALAGSFKQYFEAEGGRVLLEKTYVADVTAFFPRIEDLKARNLQLVFLPDYSVNVEPLARALRAEGIKAVFAGGDAWDAIDPTLPELEGSFYATHWTPDVPAPVSQEFVRAYQAAYGESPTPTAALSYDALQLVVAALRAQGEVSPEAIARGLQATRDFAGVTGAISYTLGGDPVKPVLIMRLEQGQRVVVTSIQP